MQTSFTDQQLENKDNKSSENILRKCVHCGMCNATCPTYAINGNELEGPRGRIYLIKDMLENKKPANKKNSSAYRQLSFMLRMYDHMSLRCKLYAFD